ncbi:HVA22-like protein k isoform X2 [Aristolochia californica]|uniref:HVA22-like protein k isoform X2 n=1 Tax=Aristolochia californica TaxID=171875 RepID=UPI0035E1A1F2
MAAAVLGSVISGDVGLRLLLLPLGSNIVMRTACCSVGTVLPVYSTFKAIENKDQKEQERWLLYWAVYGSFSIVEIFSDKILSWCPFYYYFKFALLVWFQFPSGEGSRRLYRRHLRPFLLKHQARLDSCVNFASSEVARFASIHQAEIQFVKTMLARLLSSVNQIMKDVNQPVVQHRPPPIEGPTEQNGRSNPED